MGDPELSLHPRLEADSAPVLSLGLCRVRLMRDARFPWLILVPNRSGATAMHRLEAADRSRLMKEITLASRVMERVYRPDRINVGALGNLVPQLHVHVVARRESDAAWPGPVWGSGPAVPYPDAGLDAARARLREAFAAAGPGAAGP